MADLQGSIAECVAFSLGGRDTRTLEEFEEQVASWAEEVRAIAFQVAVARFLAGNLIKFVIVNPVERHLADVHVKVHIPGEVRGFDEPLDEVDLPAPPRRFGEPKSLEVFAPRLGDLSPSFGIPTIPPQQWIEDGSINFRWNVGDLRPLERTSPRRSSCSFRRCLTTVRSSRHGRPHPQPWTVSSEGLSPRCRTGTNDGTQPPRARPPVAKALATEYWLVADESRAAARGLRGPRPR